jgi:hypothetical protein
MTDPDPRSTDPMTEHEHPTAVYDDEHLEWEDEPAPDEVAVAPRPRRRLLTPVTGGLLAVILVAGGFVGGVEVQKGQGSGSAAAGAPAGFAARAGGGAGGLGGAGGAGGGGTAPATVGTVANVKGDTLYVTGTDGTTVKVRTKSTSKVTRNAASTPGAVHPGDTVVVQGAKAASGTITATSVTATAKGVSSGGPGGGGFAGAGGGGAGAGGAGAGSGAGAGASQVPQGFAPPAG